LCSLCARELKHFIIVFWAAAEAAAAAADQKAFLAPKKAHSSFIKTIKRVASSWVVIVVVSDIIV